MKKLLFLITCGILFLSCSTKEDHSAGAKLNAGKLEQLVFSAISGNKSSNDTLGGFFDHFLPLPGEINKITIDSLKIAGGKVFYSVLVETSNPVYNRFAIYDSSLKSYLLDKSLNGNLFESVIDSIPHPFFAVKENFLSKDTLKLERLSLYRINNSDANLVLRIYTKLVKKNILYMQNIEEVTDSSIRTIMKSTRISPINDKGDFFVFTDSLNSYKSKNNIFEKFVLNEVLNFNIKTSKPQITDKKSELESMGITPAADTIKTTANVRSSDGYGLTLDENWKEKKNIMVSTHLKKQLRATRYLDGRTGATIHVIPISSQDSAEMYFDQNLDSVSPGDFQVRFSKKIETPKTYVILYELSCGKKKFLVIFEAPKLNYEQYKERYTGVFSSFEIEC